MTRYTLAFITIFIAASFNMRMSGQLVESVAGIVGNELILLSEVEELIKQIRESGNRTPVDQLRCQVFENLAVKKLYVDQARLDSIIVLPSQVEADLNLRLNYYVMQAGSEAAVEEYFKKSMFDIKSDIRELMIEERMEEEMRTKLSEGIEAAPVDVRRFFNSIPRDSVPLVPARVELSIIQIDPPSNEENKIIARQRILDLRSEILGGKSFEVMARLYSEDDGTAVRGGEVGFQPRGGLAKEYADVAFSLKNNTVSKVVETEFGFHIIQLIERRGDLVNTRHILIKPRLSVNDVMTATERLDSISALIRLDSITFETAARQMSTHKESRINGGKLVTGEANARTSIFALEELDMDMYQVVRNMKTGEISPAYRTVDENNNTVFRIVKVDREYPAHRANLDDDYQLLQNMALQEKFAKKFLEWEEKKLEVTYIKVSEEFRQCNFSHGKWLR
ncbi:MAG: peptidylprolyl isomerase [Bacteroidales bacterium]|jgi:peptidyl-prolyl cis-trans isomerase SurA|nr:peptidylprolyl isomerase [Bacteroidales bacterium]